MEEDLVDFVARDCAFVKSVLSLLGKYSRTFGSSMEFKFLFCFLLSSLSKQNFYFESPTDVVFVRLTSLGSPKSVGYLFLMY